ncbi:MAG TPA: hypothetical protein VJL30_00955 [Patescibacteria group bacterium]|nr:hypothetical protein [Patescibacteria group bacterium]
MKNIKRPKTQGKQKTKKTEAQKRKEVIKLMEEFRQMNLKKENPITWQEAYRYARTFD